MASIQKRGDKWQVRVKHKLLPRPVFFTFDKESEADGYKIFIETALDKGIVPLDLLEADGGGRQAASPRLGTLIVEYKLSSPGPAPSDLPVLDLVVEDVSSALRMSDISAVWADAWVSRMKLEDNLAPGTIRKRVESLARVVDFYIRKITDREKPLPANPLRLMPRGYSAYTKAEEEVLNKDGRGAKRDQARTRRFAPGEEDRALASLDGWKNPNRERALKPDPELKMAFKLIVNTGLRLKEMFWAECSHYDAAKGVFHVKGTKGHRGLIKPRVLPIVPALRDELAQRCKERMEAGKVLLFDFWDGEELLKKASNRLSGRFKTLFKYSGIEDFTEHDLRHEATCRWVQMKDRNGRWMWTELEIAKIMGWSKLDMMMRYASLRAEDFADRML